MKACIHASKHFQHAVQVAHLQPSCHCCQRSRAMLDGHLREALQIRESTSAYLHDDEGGPHAEQAAQAQGASHCSQHNEDAAQAQAGAPGDQHCPGPGTRGNVAQRDGYVRQHGNVGDGHLRMARLSSRDKTHAEAVHEGVMQKLVPSTARPDLLILAIGLCAVCQMEVVQSEQRSQGMRGHMRGWV